MPGVTVNTIPLAMQQAEAEALVVGFFEDVRPLKGPAGYLDWLLCGALSRLLLDRKVQGAIGDVALLTSQGKVPVSKIFLVGLGPRSSFSSATVKEAARTAADRLSAAGVIRAAMECFGPHDAGSDEALAAFREGLAEGAGDRTLMVSLLAREHFAG